MKRFTDTDKWIKNKWFSELKPEHKLLWLYIQDTCDNVGVWEENLRIAGILIGYAYPMDTLSIVFGDVLDDLGDGKWWIVGFIDFQHGELSEESASKPIISYISLLKKHNLWIDYTNPMHRVQGKGKGKGKGNGTEKEEAKAPKVGDGNLNQSKQSALQREHYPPDFEQAWALYERKGTKAKALRYWNRLAAADRLEIIKAIPAYMAKNKEAQYRKDFDGWINPANKMWENEVAAKSSNPMEAFNA